MKGMMSEMMKMMEDKPEMKEMMKGMMAKAKMMML
jgi:hypothetical protein